MPGVQVAQLEGLVDPLKTYQFRMNISPVRGTGGGAGGGAGAGGNEVLSLRCTATSLPGSELPQISVDLGGYHLMYSGMRMFSHRWPTTIIEDQEAAITQILSSWMQLIYDQRTSVGVQKANYQAQGTVEVYNDMNAVVGTRTLYGLWPTVDPDIQFTFAGGGARVDKTIIWSFDYWADDALASTGFGAVAGSPI